MYLLKGETWMSTKLLILFNFNLFMQKNYCLSKKNVSQIEVFVKCIDG